MALQVCNRANITSGESSVVAVTCLQCEAKSNTFDPFLDISLDVKNVSSITRALERFSEPETLDSENAYICTKYDLHYK